ncbi:MAG TPA: hypothetical protein VJQ57_14000 [Acidimicrobiia bacterium]|nr:hypothetical protein [Acidimicrobiia bacterium]
MSLAGPHGEGACPDCKTLVDLDRWGRVERHRLPQSVPMAAARPWNCPGEGKPPGAEQELPELAFSDLEVTAACPTCQQDVVVTTIGVDRRGRRFQPHRVGTGDGRAPYCPGGGSLVEDPDRPVQNQATVTIDTATGMVTTVGVEFRGMLRRAMEI